MFLCHLLFCDILTRVLPDVSNRWLEKSLNKFLHQRVNFAIEETLDIFS